MTTDDPLVSLHHEPVQVCPQPIFIIGAPRSGTTVLARALAEHSALWTSHESYFVHNLYGEDRAGNVWRRHYERKQAPSWLRTEQVARDEFLAYLGLGINALFTSRSGGRRWIDQTPLYTPMVDDLALMFPGAQFLHILRDGRRVVNSMVHFLNKFRDRPDALQYVPEWATDFGEACRTWRRWVEMAGDFADRNPSRCFTIRNEALAECPSTELAAIHGFLSLSDEPGPARFMGQARINSSFAGSGRRGEEAEPWQRWGRGRRATFVDEAGDVMVRHGLATGEELGDWVSAAPPSARGRSEVEGQNGAVADDAVAVDSDLVGHEHVQ